MRSFASRIRSSAGTSTEAWAPDLVEGRGSFSAPLAARALMGTKIWEFRARTPTAIKELNVRDFVEHGVIDGHVRRRQKENHVATPELAAYVDPGNLNAVRLRVSPSLVSNTISR